MSNDLLHSDVLEAGDPSTSQAIDAGALIERMRACGDDRHDPVRFRFIEALARRTAGQVGESRRILDRKLNALLFAYRDALDVSGGAGGTGAAGGVEGRPSKPADKVADGNGPPRRGALGELVDHIVRDGLSHRDATRAAAGTSTLPPESTALGYFRRTWSRLSAGQRLTRSLARLPRNPGPLNSQHLVHQSLTLMRDVSPEYLSHFMAHVDALFWLDRLKQIQMTQIQLNQTESNQIQSDQAVPAKGGGSAPTDSVRKRRRDKSGGSNKGG